MADELQPVGTHDHEYSDMSITGILWFGVGLTVCIILSYLVLVWLFSYLENTKDYGQPVSPYAPPRTLPPTPRLQVSPPAELREYRAKEDDILNKYGWVDKSQGVVRMPIDRAMELLVQSGVPAASVPAPYSGFPKNPAMATNGVLTQPRGTNTSAGNPLGLPVALPENQAQNTTGGVQTPPDAVHKNPRNAQPPIPERRNQ